MGYRHVNGAFSQPLKSAIPLLFKTFTRLAGSRREVTLRQNTIKVVRGNHGDLPVSVRVNTT